MGGQPTSNNLGGAMQAGGKATSGAATNWYTGPTGLQSLTSPGVDANGQPAPSPVDRQYQEDLSAWMQTGFANRPGQSNPFASQGWTYDPATGQWQQSANFTGALGDANNSLQQAWAQMLSQPMDDGTSARQKAYDAAYGQATSRLDPQFAKREEAMKTQLLNQGLTPGSEAYKSALADFGMQRNDAYQSAQNHAQMMAQQAGDSVFRNNLAARMAPLEQMLGMKGLLKQEGFIPTGGTPSKRLLEAMMADNNVAIGQAAQGQQATADAVGGGAALLGVLASLAGTLSDERAKRDIVRLPVDALPGVPFATWEYRHAPGTRHLGVIAQDMEAAGFGQYVSRREDGMRVVDYSFLRRGETP